MARNALLKKMIALNPRPDSGAEEFDGPSLPKGKPDLDALEVKFSDLAKRSEALADKAAVVERLQKADYGQRKVILEKLSQTFSRIDDGDDAVHKPAHSTPDRSANAQRMAPNRNEISLKEIAEQISALQRKLDELLSAYKPRVVEEVRTLISKYDVSAAELGLSTRPNKRRTKQASLQEKSSPAWRQGEHGARHTSSAHSDTNKRRQVVD